MKSINVVKCSLVRDRSLSLSAESPANTPARIAEIVREFIGSTDREHFVAILLDSRSKVLGVNLVSLGTMSASLVHPREVFKPAILASAAGLVVAHNHPSGDCTPSAEDREATRRLVRAGELLGIPVVDHVIVADIGVFSFHEHGLLVGAQ